MKIFAYLMSAGAIVVMALNLVLVIRVLVRFKGHGEVSSRLKLLLALIAFFFLGYVASPFLVALGLPDIWLVVLVFAVFFFGALYVTITLTVLGKIFAILNLVKNPKLERQQVKGRKKS